MKLPGVEGEFLRTASQQQEGAALSFLLTLNYSKERRIRYDFWVIVIAAERSQHKVSAGTDEALKIHPTRRAFFENISF